MEELSWESDSIITGISTHGGNVWAAARKLKVPVNEVLDLSASLNPLGPPQGLREAILQGLDGLCHYPDRTCSELREALAAFHGLSSNNVLPGNGSTALIRLLSRAMDLKCIVILAPAFGEFGRSLAIAGRHFHYLILKETAGLGLRLEDIEDLWDMEPTCVILTNPQTPTGGLIAPELLESLLSRARREQTWVVLDEAFMDFCPQEAREYAPPLVAKNPRLIVLRSMTKFYCLAGLRLGYLLAHENTVAELSPLAEPWGVNTLAQAAGLHCLGQGEFADKTRGLINQWREAQAQGLKDLGLKVYPSQANYLLCRLPQDGPNAELVAGACADKGVLVRDCADFVGCTPWHLRVAVCTPEEQQRLFAALKPALNIWLFGGSYK